mmetsp:Transcript_39447/g.62583  ORF Transcript_39447/g.62583 Transcript_39447/m.62583 type:complete len:207 (-) Transcript_39447:1675-2295(-)
MRRNQSQSESSTDSPALPRIAAKSTFAFSGPGADVVELAGTLALAAGLPLNWAPAAGDSSTKLRFSKALNCPSLSSISTFTPDFPTLTTFAERPCHSCLRFMSILTRAPTTNSALDLLVSSCGPRCDCPAGATTARFCASFCSTSGALSVAKVGGAGANSTIFCANETSTEHDSFPNFSSASCRAALPRILCNAFANSVCSFQGKV